MYSERVSLVTVDLKSGLSSRYRNMTIIKQKRQSLEATDIAMRNKFQLSCIAPDVAIFLKTLMVIEGASNFKNMRKGVNLLLRHQFLCTQKFW